MLEIVPDIAQSTHGNRNIFADIKNVPTRPHTVLGTFLLPFSVQAANVQKSCRRMGNGTYVFGLIASQDIPPFTEILINYGAPYIFPFALLIIVIVYTNFEYITLLNV